MIDPSGLIYLRTRWYDPVLGRFLTRDQASANVSRPGDLNAFGYAGANPMMKLDPTGLRATAGEDGGACVFAECHVRVAYSDETVSAAAGAGMMWYLETQAASSSRPSRPWGSDYTRLSGSLGLIAVDFWIDRYDRFYLGTGLAVSTPGLSLMQGYIEGDDPSAHSHDAVDSFVSGWTRNETLGFLLAYGHTAGVGDRHANEVGIATPGGSLSSTYAWRGQDAAQATVDWFLGR
jgi:RHS repeat-associated protein